MNCEEVDHFLDTHLDGELECLVSILKYVIFFEIKRLRGNKFLCRLQEGMTGRTMQGRLRLFSVRLASLRSASGFSRFLLPGSLPSRDLRIVGGNKATTVESLLVVRPAAQLLRE